MVSVVQLARSLTELIGGHLVHPLLAFVHLSHSFYEVSLTLTFFCEEFANFARSISFVLTSVNRFLL